MKILMTGSTGFVGRHLVPLLEDYGHDVYHLVRAKKGFRQELVWDFSGPLLEKLPPCDIVVHLAACVNFTQKMEISLYMVNTVSTAILGKYCLKAGASFILASTVSVHGSVPYISKDFPITPGNHYAMSKLLAEQIVQTIIPSATILRISGIYGLDGPAHLGLNTAISNAFYKKVPAVLNSTGRTRRNYICVHDVACLIAYLILESGDSYDTRNNKRKCEILYLAGPETMTIEQYLQAIVDILLPGKKLSRLEGPESGDCVVEASPAPFPLTNYRDYLTGLKEKMQ